MAPERLGLDPFLAVEVGNGAGGLEDAVVFSSGFSGLARRAISREKDRAASENVRF